MSHTVTATASYILNKYSRSYPPVSSVGPLTPVESEWQHFTNPVMKIILEVKKSPSGQLISMRLRILWSLYTDSSEMHIDQREVTFEDLELLSFSALPTFQSSVSQSEQSLRLKAVYRDAIVGIRYLYPSIVPPGSLPTYRRFQITFRDTLDASRFIDAIKSVCPCKANPQSTNTINRHSTMLSTSQTQASTTVSGSTPLRPTGLSCHRSMASAPIADPRAPVPSTMAYHPQESQTFSTVASSSVEASLCSDDCTLVTGSEMSHGTDAHEDHRRDGLLKARGGRIAAQNSVPSSSQPSSLDQSSSMPPPPVPRRVTHSSDTVDQGPPRTVNTSDERSHFLASLSKHPSLYELPRTDLETIVSQVIREEGFLHLLESLDSLWAIKGLLGH